MSRRVCANCDYVIDNRIHNDYNCPECDSSEMVSPLDDDRDWEVLYLEQELRFYRKTCKTLLKRLQEKK